MSISKETLDYVAYLARINLEPNELEKLSHQLQGILDFIDQLKELEIKDIAPTSHILPINSVLRPDKTKASLELSQVLLNAPEKQDNFFVVPQVIE